MKIGYVGLGKMGMAMVERLKTKGYEVVAWNRSEQPRKEAAAKGIQVTETLAELVEKLEPPRFVWVMVAAGEAMEQVLVGDEGLINLLGKNDVVVDGVNSFYKDSMRRSEILSKKGIVMMDCGTSGGIEGARSGASLMIGGERGSFDKHKQVFADLAAEDGDGYFGKSGAGHFVKMVHNGIEYGTMQSMGEGFEILHKSEFGVDLGLAAKVYNHGAIITSKLMGWMQQGLEEDENLEETESVVGSLGTGSWTVDAAKDLGVRVDAIERAVKMRVETQGAGKGTFQAKVVQKLRELFGGHNSEERDAEKVDGSRT